MEKQDFINFIESENITQKQAALLLGVSQACVSRWIAGSRKIPLTIELFIKCLKGVS